MIEGMVSGVRSSERMALEDLLPKRFPVICDEAREVVAFEMLPEPFDGVEVACPQLAGSTSPQNTAKKFGR